MINLVSNVISKNKIMNIHGKKNNRLEETTSINIPILFLKMPLKHCILKAQI
ncbi:hypothetical protein AB8U03_00830 [Clostridium sp. Mt-5]|uniref:Uncharacterized protein n=1 Tax=Clostridium moutaii TaxID=3240932 RepID=A0ABV4BL24_9CLOT